MNAFTNQAFFYAHAGYSYGPGQAPEEGRRESAASLANAEQFALDAGITFRWEIDPDIDSSDFSDSKDPWKLWECYAHNADGDIVASLHGIDFGRDSSPYSDPYARVVEAELALEAQANTD